MHPNKMMQWIFNSLRSLKPLIIGYVALSESAAQDVIRGPMLTHIDTTTAYSALMDITGNGKCSWGQDSTFDVTVLWLLLRDVRIPRVPRQTNLPGASAIALLMDSDGGLAGDTWYRRAHRDEALQDADLAVSGRGRITKLQSLLDSMGGEEDFHQWMGWHIDHEMADHILRVEGVVQQRNVPAVARILGKSPKVLEEMNAEALATGRRFVRRMEPLDMPSRAFAADVMVRAYFYDHLAARSGRQVVHHIVRRRALDSLPRTEEAFVFPEFVSHLAHIIRNLARARVGDTQKVAKWLELTKKARKPLKTCMRDSRYSEASGPDARKLAIKFAATHDLVPRFAVAEKATVLGGGLAGALLLGKFAAVPGQAVGWAAGRALVRPLSRSRFAVGRFAKAGRVRTSIELRSESGGS